MTSEVVLMNRSAIALAADSAVTVTYWQDGEQQRRYFKGANKIFNLSDRHPVGIMTYDTASFHGVPWEIIIKSYRDAKGGKSERKLRNYAAKLFDYIVSNASLYPKKQQADHLTASVMNAVFRIAVFVQQQDDVKNATDEHKKTAAIKRHFDILSQAIHADNYLGDCDDKFLSGVVSDNLGKQKLALKKKHNYDQLKSDFDEDELVKLGMRATFKKNWTTLQTTGLVFAGYGSTEYFPQVESYICYGFLCGKLIHEKEKATSDHINSNNNSAIIPIAKSDMIKTFMYGTSLSALSKFDEIFVQSIEKFSDALQAGGFLDSEIDIEVMKSEAAKSYRKEAVDYLHNFHTGPLRQVVGMLSIDELSELAETLILIESLKERVTRPTESVSGPIDVATISKSDGFIWIKRKHYFDPKLNSRYFMRKGVSKG